MKRILALVLVLVLVLSLVGCGVSMSGSLSGTYAAGKCSITFRRNGTCTFNKWGTYFEGTYTETSSGWQMVTEPNGSYPSTAYELKMEDDRLYVHGGGLTDYLDKCG